MTSTPERLPGSAPSGSRLQVEAGGDLRTRRPALFKPSASDVSTRTLADARASRAWARPLGTWRVGATTLPLLAIVGLPSTAEAQSHHTPGAGDRAWPSLIHVSVPAERDQSEWSSHVTVAGNAGYAFIESNGEPDTQTNRIPSGLALIYSPAKSWFFGVDVSTRIDTFPATSPTDPKLYATNLYGEPRLSARYLLPTGSSLDLGVEADVRFIGSSAPDIHAAATSPSFSALAGLPVGRSTYLGAMAGIHFDLSENAIENPALVSAPDRITLAASCCFQARFGVGASQKLGTLPTELLAELSANVLFGNGSPSIFTSPWLFSLGARHHFSPAWAAQGAVDFGLSSRPQPPAPDPVLVPIAPRVAVGITLIWSPGKKVQHPPPPPPPPAVVEEEKPEEPAPPPPVLQSAVTGLVVDEAGQGVPDVSLTLVFPDGQTRGEHTFADGTFSFAGVPEDVPVRIDVRTPGYDASKLEFGAGSGRRGEIVLYPALPAGQVRGSILDLQGQAVQATVTLNDGTLIEVAADGSFELELRPGRHTLRVAHEGFSTQQRVIEVEQRGVVILNIALSP